MWSHRNHVLHQQGTTIYQEDSQAIDSETIDGYQGHAMHTVNQEVDV